jgi:glyoxylase-like metal-dependent hydrolase (beta-lactamase superfamily II)
MTNPRITAINTGHLLFDLAEVYQLPPDHPRAGENAELPMNSFVIELPGRFVIVDAMGYEEAEVSDNIKIPGYQPPPPLLDQLESLGVDPEKVSDVIITHAHFDHYTSLCQKIAGNYRPTFPNAHHYLGAADWKPKLFDEFDMDRLGLIEQLGLLILVEGRLDLGDGLTIWPAPGETEGHQILQLKVDGQEYYFVGDLYHHPIEFNNLQTNVSWADMEEMSRSKQSLLAMTSQTDGLVYFTHIRGAYHVTWRGDEFVWQSFQEMGGRENPAI